MIPYFPKAPRQNIPSKILAFGRYPNFTHRPPSSTSLDSTHDRQPSHHPDTAAPINTMAPKKSNKGADSLNAKLALTIKVRETG